MLAERLISKSFLSILFVFFFGITGLYLLIDAFENLPDFLEQGVDFLTIVVYFLLLCPKIMFQISPLAIVLSGILSILILGKTKQILAMRTIGITPERIFRPILFLSFLLAVLFTLMNLYLIPKSQDTAEEILSMKLGKKTDKGPVIHKGQLFFRGKNSLLAARILDPSTKVLSNVKWLTFDKKYNLKEFLAGKMVHFVGGKWIFKKGLMINNGKKSSFFDKKTVDLPVTPKYLTSVKKPIDEASLDELYFMLKRLKEAGLPYYLQETVILSQIFYPFLGVSLLFLCLPIVFYRVHQGATIGLIVGTGLSFLVWTIWNMLVSMGKTGALNPVLCVSLPHIFLIGAGAIYRKLVRF